MHLKKKTVGNFLFLSSSARSDLTFSFHVYFSRPLRTLGEASCDGLNLERARQKHDANLSAGKMPNEKLSGVLLPVEVH